LDAEQDDAKRVLAVAEHDFLAASLCYIEDCAKPGTNLRSMRQRAPSAHARRICTAGLTTASLTPASGRNRNQWCSRADSCVDRQARRRLRGARTARPANS